jgi:hypothetical protein
MAEPLAVEIRDAEEGRRALRLQAERIGIPRLTIDYISGLPSGYSGKLLGRRSPRRLTLQAFAMLANSLGLSIVLVENEQHLHAIRSHIGTKQYSEANYDEHIKEIAA